MKFGEREHIRQFADGLLYFSNAKTFREIENSKNIKGQGDMLEACPVIYALNVRMYDAETNRLVAKFPESKMYVKINPVEDMPVCCLYTVDEKECENDTINLSQESKNIIRSHFPNADSVAIIKDPRQFINDITQTIGRKVVYDKVHYFQIDNGFLTEEGIVANDIGYYEYLMNDVPYIATGIQYTYGDGDTFKVLFCKDVYFQEEKEFRIILPDEKIKEGTIYPVKLTEDIKTMSLEDFLN